MLLKLKKKFINLYLFFYFIIPLNFVYSKDKTALEDSLNNYIINFNHFDYIKRIINEQNNGFLNNYFMLDSLNYEIKDSTVYIVPLYRYIKNKLYRIKSIETFGNKLTTQSTISHIININENDILNYNKISNISHKFKQYEFIELNSYQVILDTSGNAYLKLFLQEKRSTFFDGIVGFTKNNDITELYGKVQLSINNLFGTARKLGLLWQKPKKNYSEINISYYEPWILNNSLSAQLRFKQYKHDTLFIQTGYSLDIFYSIDDKSYISYGISAIYNNSSQKFNNNYPNSSELSYNFSYSYNSFDDNFTPTNGFYNKIEISNILKNNKDFSKKFNQYEITSTFRIINNLHDNLFLYNALHFYYKTGNNITLDNLYKVGGFNTIRGYDEYQFFGNYIFYCNNEFRIYTANKSSFFLFYDYGVIRNIKVDYNLGNNYVRGYGIGTIFETKNGKFSLSFAFNKNFNFNELKIHFGFLSLF